MTIWMAFLAISLCGQSAILEPMDENLHRLEGKARINKLTTLAGNYLGKDVDRALFYAREAEQQAIQIKDREGLAKALELLGRIFIKKKDWENALAAFNQALRAGRQLKEEERQAEALLGMGRVYQQTGEQVQAEESARNALRLAGALREAPLTARALRLLGDIYWAQEFYGKAIESYSASAEAFQKAHKPLMAAAVARQLGDVYAGVGDPEGALTQYRAALRAYKDARNDAETARTCQKIIEIHLNKGEAGQAQKYNDLAWELVQSLSDSIGQAECLINYAWIDRLSGYPANARAKLHKSAALLRQLRPRREVARLYEEIAAAFVELGDYKNAYHYGMAASDTNTRYLKIEKSDALLAQAEKHKLEIATLRRQHRSDILQQQQAFNHSTGKYLYALMALAGLWALTLLWANHRRKSYNQLLRKQKEEITILQEALNHQKIELETKDISLDLLNKKLLTEITEREKIEKSSFDRDQFLATMSSEMRAPLNTITGLSHVLLEDNPREDQIEHLRSLQFSANDLVVFINDVLDFSKIEAGKLHLEDREFEPEKIVGDVKKRFLQRAIDNDLLFNFFYDPKIPRTLLGDDVRLVQILTNLLSNTFRHTREGHVKLSVGLHELKAREVLLKLTIHGTDGGVDRSTVAEMFHPGRAGESGYEGYDRQQFSLAITKRLVELHNGVIDVEVTPGDSTQFTVLLPFRLVHNKNQVQQPKNGNSLNGTQILVVEDNKINQLVVSKILRKLGVKVALAANGLEALDKVETTDFDLILMDIQMPEMDGYRTTAEIRRHPNEAKRNVPIIALTASAFLTEKEKAVLFGMNDHIGKPFSPDELIDKISNCLTTGIRN